MTLVRYWIGERGSWLRARVGEVIRVVEMVVSVRRGRVAEWGGEGAVRRVCRIEAMFWTRFC